MADMSAIAIACKQDLLKTAREADENGITPDEDTLGAYGVGLSTLVIGHDPVIWRDAGDGLSGKHVETLEGDDLDTIASLFEVRIHDATQKLLAARIGL